ncbi:hypothetical protein [Dyadobacter sp. LHD-138]|uniref:hypothetical protein n=1 Tax=Dyadobacter sp. LHD-138 TaxID=3071413 RepID=UPI0027DF6320|nr:hypothetical protein [Dyadobacter sp. LHD-138]MDQ6480315.1 hypothetical protein [Dyadobacter sp. LHD-138]
MKRGVRRFPFASKINYSGTLQATSEIEEIKWLNYADQDKISDVDKIIFDYLPTKELLD